MPWKSLNQYFSVTIKDQSKTLSKIWVYSLKPVFSHEQCDFYNQDHCPNRLIYNNKIIHFRNLKKITVNNQNEDSSPNRWMYFNNNSSCEKFS